MLNHRGVKLCEVKGPDTENRTASSIGDRRAGADADLVYISVATRPTLKTSPTLISVATHPTLKNEPNADQCSHASYADSV